MRESFPRVRRRDDTGNSFECHAIACSQCGVEDHVRIITTLLPAHAVAKKFKINGWAVARDAKKHLCPACLAQKKSTPKVETMSEVIANLASDANTELVARSPAAQAAIPLLYMSLGDAYDPARKRYKDGWSDERIAKEIALSVDFVRARREADFGPVVDTRVDELEKEVSALRSEIAAIRANTKDLAEATLKAITDMRASVSKTFANAMAHKP